MKYVSAILALVAIATATAAELPKRVLSILEVEAKDPAAYTERIARFNAQVKDKAKKDAYIRVFQVTHDAEKSGKLRVVTDATAFAELTKNANALQNEISGLQREMDPSRTTGGRILYQALRIDGSSPKGSANYTTLISASDEKGYLNALNVLRSLLDESGFKDVRIGLYRVVAGRGDHTHMVILSANSSDRLSEFLDFMVSDDKSTTWIANSAKYRTVVRNFVARDISK
jgi:hypothetical protein